MYIFFYFKIDKKQIKKLLEILIYQIQNLSLNAVFLNYKKNERSIQLK